MRAELRPPPFSLPVPSSPPPLSRLFHTVAGLANTKSEKKQPSVPEARGRVNDQP